MVTKFYALLRWSHISPSPYFLEYLLIRPYTKLRFYCTKFYWWLEVMCHHSSDFTVKYFLDEAVQKSGLIVSRLIGIIRKGWRCRCTLHIEILYKGNLWKYNEVSSIMIPLYFLVDVIQRPSWHSQGCICSLSNQ